MFTSPASGRATSSFENAGRLYLLDLQTEKSHEVEIRVVTDRATLKPRHENVSGYIQSADHLSERQAGPVRGAPAKIFSAPAEHGVGPRTLPRTSGVANRYPAWVARRQMDRFFSATSLASTS